MRDGRADVRETGAIDSRAPDVDAADVAAADVPDAGAIDAPTRDADGAADAQEEADAGNDADAARDGGARILTQRVSGAYWSIGQTSAGMAVDEQDRVYLADTYSIYVVSGSSVSVFLSQPEAQASAGVPNGEAFRDLDRGPDGKLYILMDQGHILRTDTAHQAELWATFTGAAAPPSRLGAISAGLVGVIDSDGFWSVSPGTGNATHVYDAQQTQVSSGCVLEDLEIGASGVFLYQPGCNGSPLLRGNVDGSGVSALYDTDLSGTSPLHAGNFACSARDPAGGFYVLVWDWANGGEALFHLDEDADSSKGFTRVVTTPSLNEAAAQANESLTFWYCAMAGAKDGGIYIQTFHQIWHLDP